MKKKLNEKMCELKVYEISDKETKEKLNSIAVTSLEKCIVTNITNKWLSIGCVVISGLLAILTLFFSLFMGFFFIIAIPFVIIAIIMSCKAFHHAEKVDELEQLKIIIVAKNN